jgi:hypothetical protein
MVSTYYGSNGVYNVDEEDMERDTAKGRSVRFMTTKKTSDRMEDRNGYCTAASEQKTRDTCYGKSCYSCDYWKKTW